MSKYSSDFKLKIVKYGIKENHSLEDYSTSKIPYDGKFKQNMVEYMNDNNLSETVVYFRLNTPVVKKWERIHYMENEYKK